MHQKCVQIGMTVSRTMVYILIQILDPEGIETRRKGRLKRRQYFAKGPNYLWHVDSYDKLKPFGLCISGCIDGFSRRIIWLNVYRTSSNPRVIAGYYMEAVTELLGCPRMVRGDMGTENGHIARMQTLLSGEESFLYGASMHNQRIESFWCTLRKECSQFWMDTLGSLKDRGYFTGSAVDTKLIVLFLHVSAGTQKNTFSINEQDIVASHDNVCISFHHLDDGMKGKHYPSLLLCKDDHLK